MVLNIYKEQLDKTGLVAIANEFESGSEHHLRFVYLIQTLTCMLTCRVHCLTIKQCTNYYHRHFLITIVQNSEEIFSYLCSSFLLCISISYVMLLKPYYK